MSTERRAVAESRSWSVLMRAALLPIAVVGVIAVAVSAAVSPAHAAGAAVGSALAGIAFAAGPIILAVARNWAPPAVMALALGGYLLLIGALAVIYLVLLPAGWLEHAATGWTLFACAAASIAGQIRAVGRLRVLAFGSPVAPSVERPAGASVPERTDDESVDGSGERPIGRA